MFRRESLEEVRLNEWLPCKVGWLILAIPTIAYSTHASGNLLSDSTHRCYNNTTIVSEMSCINNR